MQALQCKMYILSSLYNLCAGRYQYCGVGVRPIRQGRQHNFGNNRMLYKRTKNNAGIVSQTEVMQHYIKPSFAKKIRNKLQNFNSEVKLTWISSILLKFKPTIYYYLFLYKDFAYLSKKLLN